MKLTHTIPQNYIDTLSDVFNGVDKYAKWIAIAAALVGSGWILRTGYQTYRFLEKKAYGIYLINFTNSRIKILAEVPNDIRDPTGIDRKLEELFDVGPNRAVMIESCIGIWGSVRRGVYDTRISERLRMDYEEHIARVTVPIRGNTASIGNNRFYIKNDGIYMSSEMREIFLGHSCCGPKEI